MIHQKANLAEAWLLFEEAYFTGFNCSVRVASHFQRHDLMDKFSIRSRIVLAVSSDESVLARSMIAQIRVLGANM